MILTDHLLYEGTYRYKAATQHLFLEELGGLRIEPRDLTAWMFQYRYLMGGYIKMIGLMISKLPLYSAQRDEKDTEASFSEEKATRILNALTQALSRATYKSNLLTEYLNREPYKKHYSFLEIQDRQTSKNIQYLEDLLKTCGYDLGEPLVAIWTMEIISVGAWEYARQIHIEKKLEEQQSVHISTCKDLMNMVITSEFADTLATLVNELNISDRDRMAKIEDLHQYVMVDGILSWELAYYYSSPQ